MVAGTPELELLTPPAQAALPSSPSKLTSATLVYSLDGQYLFQRQAHVLRVLNASTGRVLHECVRENSQQTVFALALHPTTPHELFAAYDDHTVVLWDVLQQKIKTERHVPGPVHWMASSRTCPSLLFLVIQLDAQTWQLIEFNHQNPTRPRVVYQHSTLAFQTAAFQSYVTASSDVTEPGDLLVLLAGSKHIALWYPTHLTNDKSTTPRAYTLYKHKHRYAVTSVALHPTQREFAIGNQRGEIVTWTLVSTRATMHWHAHTVQCLAYGHKGQSLVSGGEECVLVSWDIESGRRTYVPRLSSSIHTILIGPDTSNYVVELADHTLFQYNTVTRVQTWYVQGLGPASTRVQTSLPTRQLVFDPITSAIVLHTASSTGILQLYEPYSNRVCEQIHLSERNHVTRTDFEKLPKFQALITCISATGQVLVTLSSPLTAPQGEHQTLRFYTRRVDGSFVVQTAIDAPHGAAFVIKMAYACTQNIVVTADEHGTFKLWHQNDVSWTCDAAIAYRNERITAVAFAQDDSLLAIAYGCQVTLWDVSTHALRQVVVSEMACRIRQLVFVGQTSPFLVLVTTQSIQVWNLLSLTLSWRYSVPKGVVVAQDCRDKERFLVWFCVNQTTCETMVLVLEPTTSVPVLVRKVPKRIWSAGFHPKTEDIVFVDHETGIWRLHGLHPVNRMDNWRHQQLDIMDVTCQDKECPSSRVALRKRNVKQVDERWMGSASNALFDAPVHVLPSMTTLYRSYMDTMLLKQATKETKTRSDEIKQEEKGLKPREGMEQEKKRRKRPDEATKELYEQMYCKLRASVQRSKARRV
ncbi:hypothetical protein CCR75_005929 [Bremia lactucae]|uniref:WD repeat-containing protein 75 second beta-propeller domain-containing protein n=1 Tax=Bremia lactucae TaxID=4779 RepID=A0A976P0A8_BRELC|nr:hypothetical protein CCR75_005929 [Bremia lactucae]